MNCALQPFPFVVFVATRQWEFSFGSSLFQALHMFTPLATRKKTKQKGKDRSSICVSRVAPSYNLAPFPLQFEKFMNGVHASNGQNNSI